MVSAGEHRTAGKGLLRVQWALLSQTVYFPHFCFRPGCCTSTVLLGKPNQKQRQRKKEQGSVTCLAYFSFLAYEQKFQLSMFCAIPSHTAWPVTGRAAGTCRSGPVSPTLPLSSRGALCGTVMSHGSKGSDEMAAVVSGRNVVGLCGHRAARCSSQVIWNNLVELILLLKKDAALVYGTDGMSGIKDSVLGYLWLCMTRVNTDSDW